MSDSELKIGLIGVCGAGKTTLTEGLKPYHLNVRQIAQEHSYVPDMWQRLVDPDVLIYLGASYPVTLQRKPFTWTEKEYQEQKHRLRHAFEHADIHIDTDRLSPKEILEMVLEFLKELGHLSAMFQEANMSEELLAQINAQKALSDGVMAVLLPIIQEFHYPGQASEQIVCGDLGSFARGTNNDLSPDLDIGFFGASNDPALGFKDWTPLCTRELTGKKEGITSLDELGRYDPLVEQTIHRVQPVLDACFEMPPGSTQFNFMRSWTGYPGWVCNLSLPHPAYGTIEIDLNIGYSPSHYGIEHAKRFNRYFERVLSDLGSEAAVQLVEDIKWVKKQGKYKARDPDGWVDRTKKLAGFVVEGLFTHQYPPHTCAELMELILAHEWEPCQSPSEHWLGDQNDQIIDAGFTFNELLINLACSNDALPLGAWHNLRDIAQEFG